MSRGVTDRRCKGCGWVTPQQRRYFQAPLRQRGWWWQCEPCGWVSRAEPPQEVAQ